jgi:hypothetical protein
MNTTTASATEQVITYDAVTGRASGNIGMDFSTPITVGTDGVVTLKWWRPQRPAVSGEASASGWIDIGGLQYTADAPNAPKSSSGVSIGTAPGNCALATYSNPMSNGTAFTNSGTSGVQDPALDTATNPAAPTANLLQFTVNAKACFGDATWAIGGAAAREPDESDHLHGRTRRPVRTPRAATLRHRRHRVPAGNDLLAQALRDPARE